MIQTLGAALYKRAAEDGDGDNLSKYELPPFAFLVIIANLIVFLPLLVVLEYSLKQVYPVLAIVEDENPPAYEPVSLNPDDDAASLAEPPSHQPAVSGSKPTRGAARPVTASFRATFRLVRSSGGLLAHFRGLACFLAQGFLGLLLLAVFAGALGPAATPVATLLASLALVQYSAAWVHIVVSQPSPLRFWSRLPPFKQALHATWRPVATLWAACELQRWVPELVALALGLRLPKLSWGGFEVDDRHVQQPGAELSKALFMLLVAGLVGLFVVLPAHVVLVRVQASLLPPEHDALIPFDRSFEGRVEPALVGGKGYATMADAWATFSRAAWRRLVLFYLKIFAVVIAATFLMAAAWIPQALVISQYANKSESGGDL